MRERWLDNYYTMRPTALAALPYLVQVIVGNIAYNSVKRTLFGQGVGRYEDAEVSEFKREIWESISAILGESRTNSKAATARGRDEPFWVLGLDQPTEADAVVYAFVASGLVCAA